MQQRPGYFTPARTQKFSLPAQASRGRQLLTRYVDVYPCEVLLKLKQSRQRILMQSLCRLIR